MIGKNRTLRDSETVPTRFFPLALAGCTVLVLGMVALTVVSNDRNRVAAEHEREAVRAAVSREARAIGERLRAFAAVTPLSPPVAAYAPVPGSFHRLYLFDPLAKRSAAADPVRDMLDEATNTGSAQRDGLRGAFEKIDEALAAGDIRANIVRADGSAQLAVATGVVANGAGNNGHPVDLVAFQPVDDAMLARIAREAHTRPITLATRDEPEGGASLDLPPAAGAPVTLTWTSDRPGDVLFRTIGDFLGTFGAVLAIAILLLSYRLTHRLALNEARAMADAAHDVLTGLPNRTAFSRNLHREVERTSRGGDGFGLIYLDIDRFKEVNDTHGHVAGDRLITTAAQRIAGALRAGCRVARIGGDEFAILMCDLRDPKECAELARRIISLFADPIDLGGNKQAIVSLSIGVALCPHDARTADGIINCADLALYRAKNEGRNRFSFFEKRMGEELRMRKTVEDDLRIAIENNQLIMEFQPVVSLDGRKTIGVEALVRWLHPTQGTISPASFIRLAEECGLILPLGEWVLRHALREARRWPGLRVAVNVSAVQFRQKDFVRSIQKLLDETGVEPSQLELELTESVLLADADQAEDAMIELRAMGVRLALDDFGTGYSSLIYLRRFAFDKIKIDKSFLESTESTGESAIIVHSIVHLGRALGLTVTAEGVETQDQHRFLQALGCHELQGFLFSPPVPASEIDRIVGLRDDKLRSVA